MLRSSRRQASSNWKPERATMTNGETQDRRSILRLAVLTPLAAMVLLVIGAIVGFLLGAAIFEERYSGTDSEGLGLFFSTFFGAVVGFIVGCFVAAWRLTRDHGLSWRARLLVGGWIPAGLITLPIVTEAMRNNGYPSLSTGVAIAVSLSLLLGLVLSFPDRRWARWVGLGTALVFFAFGMAAGPLNRDNALVERLEASQVPLAIVDEAELARILPGWRVDEYNRRTATTIREVEIKILTDTGFLLTLDMESRSSSPCSASFDCLPREPLADGSRVVWSTNPGCRDDQRRVGQLGVFRRGGFWSLEFTRGRCGNPTGQPTIEELELFFQAVEPATPQEWVDASNR